MAASGRSLLALLLLGVALGAGAGEGAWPDHDPADFDYEDDDKGVCSTMLSPEEPGLTCCEGWEQVKEAGAAAAADTDSAVPRCRPVCEPACVNATCTFPNECTCLPGYSRKQGSLKHECSPRCQPLCVNADCVGPNTCHCKAGFERTSRHACRKAGSGANGTWSDKFGPGPPSGWNLCRPPCRDFQKCVGSSCICKEGFVPDPRDPASCLPECSPPCGPHAFCLANKVCRCISGYVDDGKGGCVPECEDGCVNGRCVAPGECVCNAGFEKFRDEDVVMCVPQCRPPCGFGGECVATNVCNCESGHQLSEEGDCVGICPNGTSWSRTLQFCTTLSTTVSPVATTALPEPPTAPPTPPPPPPPPPPPSQSPPTEVSPTPSQPCTPPCVHGQCARAGACKCVRGWTGADCARPCELRDAGLRFDARDCPELANCTCTLPAPDGRSCLTGARVECEQSAVTSPGDGSSGGREWPKWLWWAVGGGAVVALLLFVVVPSAVALQRRHKRQRENTHERETLQGYSPGGGRAHDHDDQWQFMPS
ncbi:hypothetical protein R5R35_007098 [Gryllus longicercus]|uniref:EGF-like domain-containing protein n=1 Tax=Gryllus longicercus TaxID=2509291 RepID=A0AAN9VIP0_9ORTH